MGIGAWCNVTTRTEELSKLDNAIKEAEVRMRTINASLDALDKEITILCDLEKTLKENVKCLKEKRVVAIAKEFRKAKDDLKRTQIKITSLKNDREHFSKANKEMDAFLKQTKRDIDRLKESLENNVLQFKPEKKDG
jgi:chromosome segregation ATPase